MVTRPIGRGESSRSLAPADGSRQGDSRPGLGRIEESQPCGRVFPSLKVVVDLDLDLRAQERVATVGRASDRGKVRLSRHGIHCFDRVTGLNVLLDEVPVPETRWARAPRYVSMALTNACELRCSYCYAPKKRAALEFDQVVRWAHELDHDGCLGLGFGGGEPTLYPQFPELCQRIADETLLAVTFTTHGHRMTRELARQLTGAVHFIRVSVDGVGATYERLRGRSFEDLRASLELVASVAPFGLNVVITSETVRELDAVAAFATRVGASELLLLPEQPTSRSSGLDTAGSSSLTDWINSRAHSIRLALSRSGLESAVPVADPFPGEDPLEAHAHIDASGTLRPDAFSSVGAAVAGPFLDALDRLRALFT